MAKTPKVKTPKIKLPKITSSWRLFTSSLAEFRTHWKPYLKIISIVALPGGLLMLLNVFAKFPTADAYNTLAVTVMNMALLWYITQYRRTGRRPTLAQTYYDGSVSVVSYGLISLMLLLMLVPSALGAALYVVGLAAGEAFGVYGPEQLLIGFVAIILALPTAYLFVRYPFAPLIAVRDHLRPVAALRASRRATLGRFWPVAGRLSMLGLFLAILALPVLLIAFGLSFVPLATLAPAFFQVVVTLILLPIGDLYLLNLLKALEPAEVAQVAE